MQLFDYLVGIADIEGSSYLILVSSSEAVIDFDNLLVFRIKDIHFHLLRDSLHSQETGRALKVKEEKKRLTRLLTSHGYFARGSNLSNIFVDAVKDFYGVPDEQGINRGVLKGLAGLLTPSNMDRYRRKEYSANFGLVTGIESAMKKQLWMFDIIIVGVSYRGVCGQD